MKDADRSNEQLQAELQKLRAQHAEQERTIRTLEGRRDAFTQLCGSYLDHILLVERRAEGSFSFFTEGLHGQITPSEGLPPFLSPAQVERCAREALQTGAPVAYEHEEKEPDGEQTRTWRVRLIPLEDPEETGLALIGSLRNVTEERRTRAALEETESLYHLLLELLPNPVVLTDSSGRLLFINAAGMRLMGAEEPEALLGRSIWDFIHPDERAEAQQRVQRLRSGDRVDLHEQRLLRLDGQEVSVEISSVPVQFHNRPAVLSTVRDLTERKQAAAHERESRSLLHKIFHASPAGITITHLTDGRYMEVNQEWRVLTGYEPEEVNGRTAAELGLWADSAAETEFLQRLQARGSVHDFEVALRTKDGALRTVLYSAQQIQVRGEPCVLTVINDISERKEAEMELVKAKEQAEEMARIKSAFLTNMTHEVRTPLTVILGFTSMLRQGVRKEYQRFVRVIERSGRRLLLMLDSILDLAQLEAGTLEVQQEPFDLTHVLQSVVTELKPLAEEKGLFFGVEIPDRAMYASIDHKIVTRVLNNLLDNAIKFTEEGQILLSIDEQDGMVAIKIQDTGIGIDQTFLPYIFNEFSQESTGLERTHQGSGLGLTVSKRLLELIGGSIEVESRKGEGSLFIVRLPGVQVPSESSRTS